MDKEPRLSGNDPSAGSGERVHTARTGTAGDTEVAEPRVSTGEARGLEKYLSYLRQVRAGVKHLPPIFYMVDQVADAGSTCQCENCLFWTVVYTDTGGEVIGIGEEWKGPVGKEKAQGVCDLMNEAHERALPHNHPQLLEDSLKWQALCNSARITAIGSSGLDGRAPDFEAHLTLNFWTVHPDNHGTEMALRWLDQYVEVAKQAQEALVDRTLGKTCTKYQYCSNEEGHEGECDDIPF